MSVYNTAVNVEYNDDDDWETDPDFTNDVDENQQRRGAKHIEGSLESKQVGASMDEIRAKVLEQDRLAAQQEYERKKTRYGIPASEDEKQRKTMGGNF